MKLSVGKKIGGGFLLVLLLLAFISAEGISITKIANKDLNDVGTRSQRISLDYQIRNAFQGAALAMQGFMVYGDSKYLAQYSDQIALTKKILTERIKDSSEESRPKFMKVLEQVTEYDKAISNNMVPLIKEGKMAEAISIGTIIAPITGEINATVSEMIANNEKKSTELLASVEQNSNTSRSGIILFSVFALAIGAASAFFITRSITMPVSTMMSGVKNLANGDFSKEISVKSRDEIGELAEAVNATREQLKLLIADIAGIAQTLAAHSEELAASAEEVSATVEEVASTTTQVAATAEKSMENTGITLRESQKVIDVASQGGDTVNKTVDKINSISNSSAVVGEAIQTLGGLSSRIGNIINVITGLADQTNLLALNAAIEAARSGDQGRGFAVVAEEVRKLAEQSANAAKEIGQLITQIQSGVDVAVQAMDMGVTEVQQGVHLASNAGEVIKEIIQAIDSNIALVEEITQGAKQTSEGTQQLSASNEQVASVIQQVAFSTQELSDLANKLQTSIAKFKV